MFLECEIMRIFLKEKESYDLINKYMNTDPDKILELIEPFLKETGN